MKNKLLTLLAALCCVGHVSAQLAKDNPNKFLGNITTSYNWAEYCDPQECDNKLIYTDYWDQVTCENACKWGSVHKGWGKFDWTNADRTYNYCKQHGIIFKFHALIWGSQHPSWIESLDATQTKKAIVEWFDEVKNHYPDLEIIDVVNEAIYSGSDYHSPYKQTKIIEALGGTTNGYPNAQSYGWLAEAFKMARERWPNAILIYNDYNTFQWQKTEFINLINGLKALNAPIDAAGCQSHDLNDMSGSNFKSALEDIHNKIQLPIYITEYDIAKDDDATQATRYKEQFPIMWEADYVAGVTLWGWIYGKTWTTNGNSGLVKNCADRSAFTWLKEYMQTDAAKNAKSPFSSQTSSVKVTLATDKESYEAPATIILTATVTAEKSISKVEFYDGETLLKTVTASPYTYSFTDDKGGNHSFKAIAYDAEGTKGSGTATVNVKQQRTPYSGSAIAIPGTVEAENYDFGGELNAYHDAEEENQGGEYRQDGVDIVASPDGKGYCIGYTETDEWLEYTINVAKEAKYDFSATVATGMENGCSFSIQIDGNAEGSISVPYTNDWDTYTTVIGGTTSKLTAGKHTLRITIDASYVNIDKIVFTENTGTDPNTDPGDIDENACSNTSLISQFNNLSLGSDTWKPIGDHNPLYTQRYGADPCAMVYNGRVYVYMTNDIYEYKDGQITTNGYGKITEIDCISSSDLVNWTDHGAMKVAGTGGISKAVNSWAPTACHATINGKEKFFLYFANNGNGIYVVTADSPYGPWTDALNGSGLITRSTPNCGNVTWLFDPAVLVDDDGTGYLYFGGGVPEGQNANPGTARVAKLGKDFISVDVTPATINPPYLFEDAGINKIGKYYAYSYCTNWNCSQPYSNAEIRYMTSTSPMSSFAIQNVVLPNPGSFHNGGYGNNHHSIFKFNNQYYITYHSQLLQYRQGVSGGYRSSNIDLVTVDESAGKINTTKGSYAGVKQVKNFDELSHIEAETFAWQSGIETKYIDKTNMAVTSTSNGDWIGLSQVDFKGGYNTVTVRVNSKNGGAIKIALDKPSGTALGYIKIPATNGQYQTISAKLCKEINTVNDIFLVFSGDMDFDYWFFTQDNGSEVGNGNEEPLADNHAALSINPNPTTGKCIISNVEVGKNITIFSINGVLLQEFEATNSEVELDLTNFENGMYFVKVGSTITKVMKK
ncbi:MAG TPA: endo-1,4-beta-xylanase [Paludibacteraceae bacterium]|nr:endo-1,4-beta-xylanase [Paludibacteraceae bacterium]